MAQKNINPPFVKGAMGDLKNIIKAERFTLIDSFIEFIKPYTYLIVGSVKAAIICVALLTCVPFLVWLERRLMGRMQARLGPNRVGPFGLAQPFSDAIKLLFKESIVQKSADKFLFFLAPAIVVQPQGSIIFPLR